jgi:putative tricarboxylic transport membrane protein
MAGHGDPSTAPRTDLIVAAVFLAFAVAVLAAAASMPTFTDQGTPLYVAPGVVPAFHAIVLAILSIILAVRAILRGALHPVSVGAPAQNLARIGLAAALALVFAVGLVGRLPFWLAAALFIFAFIMAFEFRGGQLPRKATIAAAIGCATGIGISLLFERVFLIRMP